MIGFPHAKINLGLSIISKRTDGFHNLESVFYPLHFGDILEIVPADSTTLILSGITLPGSPGDNLVIRAYQLLKDHFPQIAATRIYLHKNIPCGAGLGGGSSDAGCMLKLLNEYFGLQISREDLNAYALELGSDCPFFLQESPCHASGRGEILEPVGLDLSGYSMLLVHSGMPVSTAWAYAQIQPSESRFNIRAIIQEPVKNWRGRLVNDFEIPVFRQYAELEKIKAQLYEAGALYASMTGSGSSFYGIFEKGRIPENGISSEARQSFLP
ncbi:MAG: 4-(cytidine 5'-diphospho)-2-C-methyl-D-erythritol kinase [Bacteroidota bacterium]|nr:4-(cytidine 5'-diphospho)-2-C-methyl-D-erythritol kinase [Bacteroidota bacterium]